MLDISKIDKEIKALPEKNKAKELNNLIKKYYKENQSVNFDEDVLKENVLTAKAFFFINCKQIKKPEDKFMLIDQYKSVFYYWYSTDSIMSLVSKVNFDFMFDKAKWYVHDWQTYTRRWGYVMFISHPCKKDPECAKKLLTLLHDDQKETIQMAEAWLLCELAIFNTELIYNYLCKCKLSYRIISKAVSKITDSFRISDDWKKKFRQIRYDYYKQIRK